MVGLYPFFIFSGVPWQYIAAHFKQSRGTPVENHCHSPWAALTYLKSKGAPLYIFLTEFCDFDIIVHELCPLPNIKSAPLYIFLTEFCDFDIIHDEMHLFPKSKGAQTS